MTVRRLDGVVILEGDCPVDEAEPLLDALLAMPGAAVDWSGCVQLHTSLVQVLLAVRPVTRGVPEGDFLKKWIAPILGRDP
ncbi:hypothetical protein N825_12750 [Skermanella stibiiresistens SB22]|uniref:Uncharacterized protein n=1 Tax=Skermanella stibiiresistens SB22 TaxID=1385369 RepID=W9GXQ0_9PROT|nr:hypothetical protein [Skermanella stibiiresistens]EWY38675.1 hypothetical protein N825_12750 [Skermanella stibiiresistens SB22]